MNRPNSSVSLRPPPRNDRRKGSLTNQLVASLRTQILSGSIKPGDRLPSSRDLARDYGVSRGTIVNVIEILRAEELLVSRKGSGVFVANHADRVTASDTRVSDKVVLKPTNAPFPTVEILPSSVIDLRPCRPSVSEFPLTAWRKCFANAATRSATPDYGDPQGVAELRNQISDYARRSRGLVANADQVFVSMGIIHAVGLLADLYLRPGAQVIMEDPGYPLARQVFERAGAEVIFCPVDKDGLVTDSLPRDARGVVFIYLTPSHQFPTGGRLSIERRTQIVEWAMRNKVLVLEDDYDGEYRYDVPPLPPMAAMPNECVVYLGTFSKTLFPDVRVGYVIASAALVQALVRCRTLREYDQPSSIQYALCDFIGSGLFAKHIRRMSKLYKEKRLTVVRALRALSVPGVLTGLDSGLHAVLTLDDGIDAEALSVRLAKSGLSVPPISHYQSSSLPMRGGLVIGYAAASFAQLSEGISLLAGELRG